MALVSAPAGFGKSTLVSGWVAGVTSAPEAAVSAAWLSLDDADNDAVRFLAHLDAAVATVGLRVGAETDGSVDAERVITSLVNEVASVAATDPSHRWVLVVDDYHVISTAVVHEALTFLVEHAPASFRLVVTTRSDPPLPLARLRSRGQLAEVRAADLRFTAEEAADFLSDVMQLDLQPGDVVALEQRTEGWAAGLQLAGLSLRGRTSQVDIERFVSAFTGSNRFVLDYLTDEVLGQQSPEVREFLLRTSVLDQLTGPLCDAVASRTRSDELLAQLDRDNLFVVPLDQDRTWYRYHHLFADVLRARLLASGTDVPPLHRAACDWYAEHGGLDDAVRHSFAAEDYLRAGRLVEAALPQVRRERRDGLLLSWLRALPDEVVRQSPVLSSSVGWADMMRGDLDGLERRLGDAERALAAGADDPVLAATWTDNEDLRIVPATIQMYRAALAQARGQVTRTAVHARAALELAGPEDHFVRGAGFGFLGLAAWAAGDVAEALPTFEKSAASLRAAGNHVDALDGTIVLADMWVAAGRPGQARELLQRALERATSRGEPYPRATADLHTSLAELAYERDDLAEAEAELATAASLAERSSITENRHRWPTVMARVRAAQGQFAEAHRHLDEAAGRHRAGFYPDLRPIAALRARIHLEQGKRTAALGWAEQAGVHLDDDPVYAREYEHLTLIRAYLPLAAEGDTEAAATTMEVPPAALSLLARLEAAASAGARAGSLLEVRFLQSAFRHVGGDVPGAVDSLVAAVESAPEVTPYGRLFLDAGPAGTALLEAAAATPDASTTLKALVHRLLGVEEPATDEGHRPAATGNGSVLPDPLSEREREVLQLLATDLTGPQIARELYISLNTLRTHTKRIFTKLDVNTRAAAVRRARDLALLA